MILKIRFFNKIIGHSRVEKNVTSLKPIEAVNKIEPLRVINEDTVSFSDEGILFNLKKQLLLRLSNTINQCDDIILKFDKVDDYEYKNNGNGKEIKKNILRIKNTLNTYLNAINNSTSLADLQELGRIITNFYAIEVEIYLASYIREIMERYHATVVEENYKFTEEGISKWRAEAMDIFPSLDLTVYNDYQLKEYVVAFKSGIPVSLLEKIIDTRRSPDHIRLMFLLSESEMLHVIEHPEYGVSKIQFMFPNLLKEIEKSKK